MLTDEELIEGLRGAFADELADVSTSARFATVTNRRLRNQHLRIRGLQLAAPVLAAAAVAAVISTSGTPHPVQPATVNPPSRSAPLAAGSALQLDGYTLVLPATFTRASGNQACLRELNLSAGEQRRLFNTPDANCPLLIAAVRAGLPAGAYQVDATVHPAGGAPQTVTFYRVFDAASQSLSSYLPSKLPDGRTVYVILGPRVSGPSDEQLVALEQGLRVTS